MSGPIRRMARWSCPLAGCVLLGAAVAPDMAEAQVWQPGNRMIGDPVSNQVDGRWGSVMITGDFNGDGRDDLAAGTPFKDRTTPPPTLPDAGQVAVYLSGTAGLAAAPDVIIGGFEDWQTAYAIAAGDFDNDGDDELAVSRPGSSIGVGSADHAGGVWIYFRSDDGTWYEESVWYQGNGGIPDASEPFDQIGQSLAVGDFNLDPYDDLVIGIPGENLETPAPTRLDAGALAVLYGSPSGLTDVGAQFFHEGMGGLGGGVANAHFGFSLATGHFSDDLYDDLVVGIPYRDAPGAAGAGQIVVLFGGPGGLSTAGFQRFDDADFGGAVAAGDHFGYALAAGRFHESGACPVTECYDQLVLGIPGEPVSGNAEAGGFLEVPGSSGGLTPLGAIFWQQAGLGGFSAPEVGDHFGEVLVAGQLDARTGVDLVVGVPGEDWVGDADQGCIHLVFGGPAGLVSYPSQGRIQDGFSSGPGAAGDRFGASLAIGDFNSDGTGDLAAGIPGREASGIVDAGRIQLFRGALFADGFESQDTSAWSSVTF